METTCSITRQRGRRASHGLAIFCVIAAVSSCGGGSGSNAGLPSAPTSTSIDDGTVVVTTNAAVSTPTSVGSSLIATSAPLPPAPDPAPALTCDGSSVLCVDASAGDASASEGGADGSAAAPFRSIGDALTVATAGSTVQIAAGTYDEPIVLTGVDDLRLIGGFAAGGDFAQRDSVANETLVVGTDTTPVIDIAASTRVHIEGLRLSGGGGHTDTYNWYGGGIYVDYESSDITIVSNRIDGNAVDHGGDPGYAVGGGIATDGTGVRIVGNVIEGNRAGRGAGISAIGETTIERNVIRDNTAVGDHGGGIYAAGDVTILANWIEGNEVGTDYSWGGGIIVYGDGTTATLQGNTVTDNMAVSAGSGVFVDDGAEATLVNELYDANRCTVDGGVGLFVDSGGEGPTRVTAVNITIANNDCPDSALGGNAILAEVSVADAPPPQVSIRNSILWGNAGLDVFSAGAAVDIGYSISEMPVDGIGNLSHDPQFVDPASGDFRLSSGSPGIDAGDPTADFGGEPEPNGGRVDLGHTGNTPHAQTP